MRGDTPAGKPGVYRCPALDRAAGAGGGYPIPRGCGVPTPSALIHEHGCLFQVRGQRRPHPLPPTIATVIRAFSAPLLRPSTPLLPHTCVGPIEGWGHLQGGMGAGKRCVFASAPPMPPPLKIQGGGGKRGGREAPPRCKRLIPGAPSRMPPTKVLTEGQPQEMRGGGHFGQPWWGAMGRDGPQNSRQR